MENSKKLQWKKIEVIGGINNKPSSIPRKTVLLDGFLLCFLSESEICIFDILKGEWSKITPENSNSTSLEPDLTLYVIDQSTLIALESKLVNYKYAGTSLHQLTIDKTQVPWRMRWQTPKILENFRYRQSHTAQAYKKSLYIFGGKDVKEVVQDDLLIFNPKTCTYLQLHSTIKPNKRYDHSSLIHNEKLFIHGGTSENGVSLNDIWSWDLRNNSTWQCAFSSELFVIPLSPPPAKLSLMQGFENTLFIFQKYKTSKYHILLSYDLNTFEWGDTKEYYENVNTFVIHNRNLILWKNDDFYTADLLDKGSLIPSKIENVREAIKDYEQLFNEQLFCDVTFKVDGEEIRAHKAILACRSAYFKQMFTSNMRESQSQAIEVQGVKKDVFKALIEFLYCGSTNMTEGIALDLLRLSDEYQLTNLKNRCETFMVHHIKPELVIDIIITADQFEAFILRKAALEYIMTNIKAIKKVDKVLRLTESVLCDLIDRGLE